jgi:O-antigen ligase
VTIVAPVTRERRSDSGAVVGGSAPERPLAFLFGAVSVAALAVAEGGFFPSAWPWATVGLAAAGAIGLLLRHHVAFGRLDLVMLIALGAFTAWIALSGVWSDDATASLREARRALLYLAGLVAALIVVDVRFVRPLLGGVVTAITAVALVGLVSFDGGGSLEGPLGYANALGILVVFALLLLVALTATVAARSRLARVALGVCAALLLATLVLTASRGAWVSLVGGLLVVAVVRRPRIALAAAPLAAAGAVAAGVLLDLGDRPYYWRAALEQYRTAPLTGTGAGTFAEAWLQFRPDDLTLLDTPQVMDAHSLYLETLAELGPVGIVLLAAALAVPLVAAGRRRREPWVAGVAGCYGAYLIHAGLDWDWEMPAVTFSALLCGVALLVAARDRELALGRRGRAACLAMLAATVAFSLASEVPEQTAGYGARGHLP